MLQIRRGKQDNLWIIVRITPLKHMFTPISYPVDLLEASNLMQNGQEIVVSLS